MGLLEQPQATAPEQTAQPTAKPQQPPELDPQTQQQVDLICNQASDYITQDENTDQLVAMSKNGPAEGIANLATTVLKGIYAAASQAGKTIPQEVMAIAGAQVALLFAAVLANEGVIDVKHIQQVAQQAYDMAVQQHNARFKQPAPAQSSNQPGPMAAQGV